MNEKKGNGGTLAAALAGFVDAALAVILLLLLLVPRASAGRVEASLPTDFAENADSYGQLGDAAAGYPSAGTVTYTGTAPAARPQAEPEQGQEPAAADNAAEPDERREYEGFVFPDSNVTELSDSRIAEGAPDAASCRRAINELYARYGYEFSKKENIDFFSAYGWYKNMEKDSDMNRVYGRFNSVEKKNLEKLQAYEKANGWN